MQTWASYRYFVSTSDHFISHDSFCVLQCRCRRFQNTNFIAWRAHHHKIDFWTLEKVCTQQLKYQLPIALKHIIWNINTLKYHRALRMSNSTNALKGQHRKIFWMLFSTWIWFNLNWARFGLGNFQSYFDFFFNPRCRLLWGFKNVLERLQD
jgi:hypothetical protein